MSDSLLSTSWHRVRDVVPRLRAQASIQRQRVRGETWFVVRDAATERHHRLSPAAYRVVGWMNGERTLHEVWELAAERLGDDAPTQDELIALLGQLHAADVLATDVTPDAAELFDRWKQQRSVDLRGRWSNPFAIRVGLLDPEAFLAKTLPLLRFSRGWIGAALWLAVVVPAAFGAAVRWDELSENALNQLFTAQGLLAIWLLFPLLKVLHELGHGYAVKAFGGEVHEMGIMLLVFTPVPYVDASAAWSFPGRWQRALVGAAGMAVELFVAALAFFVWLWAEPGVARAVAYNVLLISGATTLLFNANPLLRFDGYYIACDVLELPNLRQRANAYLGALVKRKLFGARDAEPPHTAPGEAAWLVVYPIAAFAYRVLVTVAILTWLLDVSLVVGSVLGAIAIWGFFGKPLISATRQLLRGPELAPVRTRAVSLTGALLLALLVPLFSVPAPLRTRAEGVVWVPEEALVRASSSGFVQRVVATPNAPVLPGAVLIETLDREANAEVARLEARLRELDARYVAALAQNVAWGFVVDEQREVVREELDRARERVADGTIEAAAEGRFVIPRADDLPGRFVEQGQLLAHVVDLDVVRVRAVVAQDDVWLVRDDTRAVAVRFAENLAAVRPAAIRNIVPAASRKLPSPALGSAGGGEIPVDPGSRSADQAAQSLFEVELELPAERALLNLGGRVFVRFEHSGMPLALQWWRQLRQTFLGRFHV